MARLAQRVSPARRAPSSWWATASTTDVRAGARPAGRRASSRPAATPPRTVPRARTSSRPTSARWWAAAAAAARWREHVAQALLRGRHIGAWCAEHVERLARRLDDALRVPPRRIQSARPRVDGRGGGYEPRCGRAPCAGGAPSAPRHAAARATPTSAATTRASHAVSRARSAHRQKGHEPRRHRARHAACRRLSHAAQAHTSSPAASAYRQMAHSRCRSIRPWGTGAVFFLGTRAAGSAARRAARRGGRRGRHVVVGAPAATAALCGGGEGGVREGHPHSSRRR